MDIKTEPFTIDLYDKVLSLWRRCDGIGLGDSDSRENIARYLKRNPGISLVALDGSGIVGSVLAGDDGRRGFMHHLAVDSDYRRQGIGSRLVSACLKTLEQSGIIKCHLFVFRNNIEGTKFWESAGWHCRDDLKIITKLIKA